MRRGLGMVSSILCFVLLLGGDEGEFRIMIEMLVGVGVGVGALQWGPCLFDFFSRY